MNRQATEWRTFGHGRVLPSELVQPVPTRRTTDRSGGRSGRFSHRVVTIQTSGAYDVDDCFGGLLRIAGVGSSGLVLPTSHLWINGGIDSANDVVWWFFDAEPTLSTCQDNLPVVLHPSDWPKLIGQLPLSDTMSFANARLQFDAWIDEDTSSMRYHAPTGQLWLVQVVRFAFTAAAGATLSLSIWRDG